MAKNCAVYGCSEVHSRTVVYSLSRPVVVKERVCDRCYEAITAPPWKG